MRKLLFIILIILLPSFCYAGGGDFPITLSASRTSGVGPLTVFFDVSETSAISSTYHQSTCYWQFDTTCVDVNANYRTGSGFVAAHVFENPGTYTVRVDIFTTDQQHAWETVIITVTEFSGTTYYVADDGNDNDNTGTSTQSPFRTPEHALSSTILGPNVRVLFKNGDTFTTTGLISISNETGPIIIGNYSDPAEPSTVKPLIYADFTGNSSILFFACSDIRWMNIDFRSVAESSISPQYPYGPGWGYYSTHMLKYRCEEHHNGGMNMNPRGQYSTVAECVYHDTSNTGYAGNIFGGTNTDGALIGNYVYNKNLVDQENEEHCFRLQGGDRWYIAHNTFGPDAVVNYDTLSIRGNSTKVVIYKNTIYDYETAFKPQDNQNVENQQYCIVDSNLFVGGSRLRDNAISIKAKDIVVRNNIIYNYKYGVAVGSHPAVGDSTRIDIENNTMINPTETSGHFNLVWIDDGCTHVNILNNILFDEVGIESDYTQFIDLRGTSPTFDVNSTSNYNIMYSLINDWTPWGLFESVTYVRRTLSAWQTDIGQDINSLIANPLLISTVVNNKNFCKFKKNSSLTNAGAWTPAYLDFYGNFWDSSRDIGAVEYLPSALSPSLHLLLFIQ